MGLLPSRASTITAGSVVIVSPIPGSWSVAPIGGATVTATVTGELIGVVGGSTGSVGVPAPSGTQTASYFWVQRAGNAQNVLTAASEPRQMPNCSHRRQQVRAGWCLRRAAVRDRTYSVNGMVISQAAGSNTSNPTRPFSTGLWLAPLAKSCYSSRANHPAGFSLCHRGSSIDHTALFVEAYQKSGQRQFDLGHDPIQ